MDWSTKRVMVTGGAGFLGRAVHRLLEARGCSQIAIPRRAEFDLTDVDAVRAAYDRFRPEVVMHLAAEVGGIGANRDHPGRFFYANLAMGLHLIEEGRKRGLEKFIQTGTVCAYPKHCPVPFQEEDLWNGYPEETNAPYGVAKKSLFVMLDAYRAEYGLKSAVVLPVNLYGPHDNFDPHTSHVIPALIRKCIAARDGDKPEIEVWGTGRASREFLFVEDAAEGILAAAERMDEPVPINLGTGQEITIRDLAQTIARLAGFKGRFRWDPDKPDGQPRRCLDTTRAERMIGWRAGTSLEAGLGITIDWFQRQTEFRQVCYGDAGS
ncbi:MAG: GDP-L-fucose synthase [Phycisphaeraceae bacterium]|nr:GDP-L-fucose synthase [Phycisphaeraceae bacterium]